MLLVQCVLQVRKHNIFIMKFLREKWLFCDILCFFQQQAANESAMEEELGLIGASAEDTEAELIRKICETELLAGNENLLSFAFLAYMKLSLIPTLL